MILDFQHETADAIKVWENGNCRYAKYLAIRKTGNASDINQFAEEIPFALLDLAELCENEKDQLSQYLNIAKGIKRKNSNTLHIPIGWLRAAEIVDSPLETIEYYKEAVRSGIDSAYHELAELYRNMDQYDKIKPLYSRANEDSPSVLHKYGDLLLKCGEIEDAIDVFMKDPLTGYQYLSKVVKSDKMALKDGLENLGNYFQNQEYNHRYPFVHL
jgi:tetratricopeptide (TPR) repeat protein